MMTVLKQMESYGHEQVVFAQDEKTGLKTIIGIHDTTLGPAVGGTRMWNYASEEDALYDVLRLSRGMTMKNAAANLQLGGGKAVIIGDPQKLKSKEFFHAYGRIIDTLSGNYYTAEDVNTNTTDIAHIQEVTKYVTGTPAISGNPSPFTALGVFRGMKAGVKSRFGLDDLKGLTISVMGLGSVGYILCELMKEDGATLKVYDINQHAVEKAVLELNAIPVSAEDILTTDCDIFAPCALGAVLNVNNVKSLKCKIVCGAANNVLVDAKVGNELENLDILYLPDFIVNAGGIINCGLEITETQFNFNTVTERVNQIYDTTLKIIALAKEERISTNDAAEKYAMNIVYARRAKQLAGASGV